VGAQLAMGGLDHAAIRVGGDSQLRVRAQLAAPDQLTRERVPHQHHEQGIVISARSTHVGHVARSFAPRSGAVWSRFKPRAVAGKTSRDESRNVHDELHRILAPP
jgi:hypothetical protein